MTTIRTPTAPEAARLAEIIITSALHDPTTAKDSIVLSCTMDIQDYQQTTILTALTHAVQNPANGQLSQRTAFQTSPESLYDAKLVRLAPAIILATVHRATMDPETGQLITKEETSLTALVAQTRPTTPQERTPGRNNAESALQDLIRAVTASRNGVFNHVRTIFRTKPAEGRYMDAMIQRAVTAGDHLRDHPSRYSLNDASAAEITFTPLDRQHLLAFSRLCGFHPPTRTLVREEDPFHIAIAPVHFGSRQGAPKETGHSALVIHADAEATAILEKTPGITAAKVETTESGRYARHSDGQEILQAAAKQAGRNQAPDWDLLSHPRRRAAVLAAANSPDWNTQGFPEDRLQEILDTFPDHG